MRSYLQYFIFFHVHYVSAIQGKWIDFCQVYLILYNARYNKMYSQVYVMIWWIINTSCILRWSWWVTPDNSYPQWADLYTFPWTQLHTFYYWSSNSHGTIADSFSNCTHTNTLIPFPQGFPWVKWPPSTPIYSFWLDPAHSSQATTYLDQI